MSYNISVTLVEKLEKLAKIQIKQGGEGFFDSWKLDRIVLVSKDPNGEDMYLDNIDNQSGAQIFNFDTWIKANKVYDCSAG